MDELKPPETETLVGLEVYKSGSQGVGGRLKQIVDDFMVEEITPEGRTLDFNIDSSVDDIRGNYVHFTLQKSGWDTMRAIKEIAGRLRVSQRRLSFAGTKDKRAVSTQRVSIYGIPIDELKKLDIKDIRLKDFRYADDAIGLGDLWGNRFSVSIRDLALSGSEAIDRIHATQKELAAGFPNYFGLQRFGEIRPVTHLVGKEILRGNFERAVFTYLTKSFPSEPQAHREFREKLSATRDFKEALKTIPRKLDYEAAILNRLVQSPDDYVGALRVLPKNLSMMFVHAYQSFIFNKALSECIRRNLSVEKLPLVGTETGADELTARILETEGVKTEEFRVRDMPELSSRGEYRDAFKQLHDFKVTEVSKDELNEGRTKATLQFKLEKGCYATIVLREFMKNQ